MKQAIIQDSFWEVFPDGQINLLILNNIDNHINEEKIIEFTELLNQASKDAHSFLGEEVFSQNEVVKQWREAYSQFKTKKGARSSIEALLKRVNQDKAFSPINPLVDIYNSISLSYGVPCGGEDIDTIEGNLYLGKAKGGESFKPLGAEEDSPALPEEIIHYDDKGAICRSLNWREAQRTMLTEDTKNAVLVIESVYKDQIPQANDAIKKLKQLADEYFKTEGELIYLTKEHPTATIES